MENNVSANVPQRTVNEPVVVVTEPSTSISNIIVVPLLLLVITMGAVIYYLLTRPIVTAPQPQPTQLPVVTPIPTTEPIELNSPLATPSVSKAPVSGSKYTNLKYGFEMTYPATYKILTDNDSLSGYPKGIALLYTGGQAYDVIIEVWDTKTAYVNKYANRLSEVTAIQSKGKYITFLNNTSELKNKEIINSVKVLP